MGEIRDSQTEVAIQQSMETTIGDTDETLDLTVGTVIKDIVVDAPASQMRALVVLIDFVGSIQSLDDLLAILANEAYLDDLGDALPELSETQVKDMISSYIDGLAANYDLTRNAAIAARYRQRFYRADNNGGSPVTVPAGSQVQNADGSIKAEVQVSTPQVPTLDTTKGLYYVEETVVAVTAGSAGNTALNSLSRFVAAIPAIATQTGNVSSLVAGQDEENDADLVQRIKDSFKGRNINTIVGYRGLVEADPLAFTDAKVVGPGDNLMTRLATGGIDIYVVGSDATTTSETQTYSSVQNFYLLSLQPVSSILSVVGSTSGTIAPANYTLSVDVGDFADSSRARNRLQVTNHSAFVNGETLTITYIYDSRIVAAQNLLESEDFNVPDADVLVKSGSQVNINLDLEVILDGSVEQATVQATIASDFAIFLAGGTSSRSVLYPAFGIGQDIDKSDLLAVLTSVAGVDRVDLDTFKIYTVRDGGSPVEATTDPVSIDDNEFARAGTVTFL